MSRVPSPLLGTGARQEERLPWPGLPSRLQRPRSPAPVPEPCRAGIVPPSPFLASPAPCSLCRLSWNFWGRKLEPLEAQGREGWAHATSSCCWEPVICHPDGAASAGPWQGTRAVQGARGGPAGQRQPQPFLALCRAPGCALACAFPCGPARRCLRAVPSLAQAGAVFLGRVSALASGCEVSAHLGRSSVTSAIRAAEANYCHMLSTI